MDARSFRKCVGKCGVIFAKANHSDSSASSLVTYVLVKLKMKDLNSYDEQNKIYQRFYRGSSSTTAEGSGVGLYLTRKIIEEQGGTVMVKQRHPRGSNFQLTLPAT